MNKRQILVHFGRQNEIFDVEDFNTMTADNLLADIKWRFNLSITDLIGDNFHFLYDGPYTKKTLTDERLHEIDEIIRKKLALDRTLEPINAQLEPIELWLCDCRANNIFLSTNVEMENAKRSTKNVDLLTETVDVATYVPPQTTASVNRKESTSVLREEFPFIEKRTALRVTVHRDERTEDIEVEDINNTTLDKITKIVKERFFENDSDGLFAITESLYEGPSSARLITDESYREIVTKAQKHAQGDRKGVNLNVIPTIELWLLLNNEVLLDKDNMENGQISFDIDALFDEIVSDVASYVPPPTTTVNPAENGLPEDDRHKFIIHFRKDQKKQYRSDGSCRANKKKKLNNVTTSSLPSSARCKAKKNDRKSITHLQAVKSKEGSRRGEYPLVQLPNSYADLLQQGNPVWLCIAVGKKIDNRRYLDALKGFLMDIENPAIPLCNPVVCKLNPTNMIRPIQYQLKLRLIQVSGDLRRSSTVEFNENFDFKKTVVDETTKLSNCDSANNNDDESDDFQIYVVLATSETPLKVNWSTLIESPVISYVPPKSKKKIKQITGASAVVQDESETTQDEE